MDVPSSSNGASAHLVGNREDCVFGILVQTLARRPVRGWPPTLNCGSTDALDTFLAEYDKTTTSSERSNQEI